MQWVCCPDLYERFYSYSRGPRRCCRSYCVRYYKVNPRHAGTDFISYTRLLYYLYRDTRVVFFSFFLSFTRGLVNEKVFGTRPG